MRKDLVVWELGLLGQAIFTGAVYFYIAPINGIINNRNMQPQHKMNFFSGGRFGYTFFHIASLMNCSASLLL